MGARRGVFRLQFFVCHQERKDMRLRLEINVNEYTNTHRSLGPILISRPQPMNHQNSVVTDVTNKFRPDLRCQNPGPLEVTWRTIRVLLFWVPTAWDVLILVANY